VSGYPLVLLLASLPAIGNFAGALLAEAFDVSERALSLALHLAAGIVLGVIGIELMPRAAARARPGSGRRPGRLRRRRDPAPQRGSTAHPAAAGRRVRRAGPGRRDPGLVRAALSV